MRLRLQHHCNMLRWPIGELIVGASIAQCFAQIQEWCLIAPCFWIVATWFHRHCGLIIVHPLCSAQDDFSIQNQSSRGCFQGDPIGKGKSFGHPLMSWCEHRAIDDLCIALCDDLSDPAILSAVSSCLCQWVTVETQLIKVRQHIGQDLSIPQPQPITVTSCIASALIPANIPPP